ncbi:MAG: zinc ribbon domain-containing protein [Pseudomonadota bacterium]
MTDHRGDKMPVYEYSCDDCGTNFEESAPISRFAEPCACPACGAMAFARRRVILSAAVGIGGS